MKQDQFTIMLGASFYKNTDQLLETLESFSPGKTTASCKLVVGLENELHKDDIPPTKRGTSLFEELRGQGWDACCLWDDELNRTGMSVLRGTIARPFYGNFSYGAAVNRLMLLANMAGASILVRIDPGARCGSDFGKLLQRHLELVAKNPGCIISAQYSGRQAIRDEFVASENRPGYYELVYRYTGINPAPGCQLTGGAAFTMTADCLPAIPFDGVRVWGSDDGFFQVMEPTKTIVQREYAVERAEAGFGMDVTAYMERVANMVVLKVLFDGLSVDDGYEMAVQFVDEVRSIVEQGQRFDKELCLIRVKSVVLSIRQGYANYAELKKCWRDLQRTMRERIPVEAADVFGGQ